MQFGGYGGRRWQQQRLRQYVAEVEAKQAAAEEVAERLSQLMQRGGSSSSRNQSGVSSSMVSLGGEHGAEGPAVQWAAPGGKQRRELIEEVVNRRLNQHATLVEQLGVCIVVSHFRSARREVRQMTPTPNMSPSQTECQANQPEGDHLDKDMASH